MLALEPYAGVDPLRFEIPTTDGRLRPAERAGEFRFALMGSPQRLTAYRIAGVRPNGGPPTDLLLAELAEGTSVAGVFTRSRTAAAPRYPGPA